MKLRVWPVLLLAVQTLANAASTFQIIRNIYAVAGKRPALPTPLPLDGPLVSVIVPARNEERSIERCLTSLLAQSYRNFEIIAVDDGSSDATPAILARLAALYPRLRVVRVDELPPGWAGKAHALHTGIGQARGEWLLFTDADTCHRPATLATFLAVAHAGGADLLSIITHQELCTVWEKVMTALPMMGLSTLFPMSQVEDPKSDLALANGQFMLLRRSAYQEAGGYPAIRSVVLDDIELAKRFKQAGKRIALVDGRRYVSVRMYHTFAEFWRGWGKNVYPHNTREMVIEAGGMLFVPLVYLLPFLQFARALLDRKKPGLLAISAVQIAMILAGRRVVDRVLAVPWYYAFSHPLAIILFQALLLEAFWRTWTGRGVGWKARTYLYNARGDVNRLEQKV